MTRKVTPLLLALRAPGDMAALDLCQWDLLLRQAEGAGMSATVLYLAEEQGVLAALPAPVREHLEWARVRAERHRRAVAWEVALIAKTLAPQPLVLLKGAAYALAGLPPARGRLFSDIDILVPAERLGQVEAELMLAGWVSNHPDPYDQRYYRDWMHELPPMQHAKRQTLIDVHHAILPRTAAAQPDPQKLRSNAHALPGHPGLHVLAPADMVLHAAAHLFYEGEFEHGLRGLFDLHRLLVHFGDQPGFWEQLPARAQELELARPLFYALRYAVRLLHAPVPASVLEAAAAGRPNRLLLALMDQLFERVLLPFHPSCSDPLSGMARLLLYIRGNWLRMPPLMLARHLFHKAVISPRAAA
ncbi:nucleotidyltransferase domain-containing protein [Massilia horti]|uniref:Nucleotidyltransferase family protein n=1 Tax=Massilia horti TaxID=2562153 RepID=A0A4Y9SW48_9BURK|nr:nucleotidyltransferase family protein [Massilia horti]TFW30695.1 hypothetical protein E4O92_16150 [Massilia horti]